MQTKNEIFYEKIWLIYKKIAKEDLNKFTELFYIKSGKTTKKNRKTYIKKWLFPIDGKLIYPKMFKSEYDKYPFSQLKINGKALFNSGEEFLEIDIKKFSEKIKEFLDNQIGNIDYFYKYIYLFNLEKNHYIDFYKIIYQNKIIDGKFIIKIYPSKDNALDIEPYFGYLEYSKNKIILNIESKDNYMSIVFNTNLAHSKTKCLVGMGVGISNTNQISIAKKAILAKDFLDIKDNNLYLTLNETEMLYSKENLYSLEHYNNNEFYSKHLEKYIDKIEKINSLFINLYKNNLYLSFYEQLSFREFLATNNIFQKLKNKKTYYINSRRRIIDILIQSYTYEKYKKLYIVMPTFQDDNIFEQLSQKDLIIQRNLIELSKKVEISIIFVLKNYEEKISYEFKIFLEKIMNKINIYFAFKDELETIVNSIDFIYTDKENFLVYKYLRVDKPVFNISLNTSILENYQATYQKIRNRSLSYEDYITSNFNKNKLHNSKLIALVGKWHYYTYGSYYQDNKIKFWNSIVEIFLNGEAYFYNNNEKKAVGMIIIKTNQIVIVFDDICTKRSFFLFFDNSSYKEQKVFIVKSFSKQINKDLDIFTIGIMSKESIPIDKIKEILGDINKVRLLEDNSILNRLTNYIDI